MCGDKSPSPGNRGAGWSVPRLPGRAGLAQGHERRGRWKLGWRRLAGGRGAILSRGRFGPLLKNAQPFSWASLSLPEGPPAAAPPAPLWPVKGPVGAACQRATCCSQADPQSFCSALPLFSSAMSRERGGRPLVWVPESNTGAKASPSCYGFTAQARTKPSLGLICYCSQKACAD